MRSMQPAWIAGLVFAGVVLAVAVFALAALGGGSAVAMDADVETGTDRADFDRAAFDRAAFDRAAFDAVAETAPEHGSAALEATDGTVAPAGSVEDDLTVRTELRQVDSPGEYGATTHVTVPDRVTQVEVTLPEEARPVGSTGFETDDGRTYEWDGSTAEPQLRFRMAANRTGERGPLAGEGNYLFVDAGEWALVRMPNLRIRWGGYGTDVRLRREHAVDGEGAAGDVIAYLGPHEEHVREAHGQRIRLVVPEAAGLEEPPEAILATLADSSDALRVGDRDSSVFVVAAPTDDVSWAVRGLQTGPSDVWVRDVERLDDPENVWIHEYVHTRQRYRVEESARWFTEASATYYAALLTLERGDVDFEEFRRVLARGERSPQADAVLSEPATWHNSADYTKGALVAGELDRQIRLETGGEATLATAFRELNARGEPTDEAAFCGLVDDAGGAAVASDAERFTTTRAAPATWDEAAHDEAFGRLPARIGYSIAADDAVRATGPYRNRAVAREPVVLVAGETLALAVEIENTGGTAGEYDLTMVVDGRVVESRDGRIGANETTVERFEREFDRTGEREVDVGGERLSVVVREPASPTVTGVDLFPAEVDVGEATTVTATVRNDAGVPAYGEFPLVVGDDSRDPREVFLDVDGETTLEWTVRPDRDGEIDVQVGDRSRTLSVTAGAAPTGTPAETGDPRETPTRTPGFGPVATVIALVAALVAVVARRR